MKIWLSVVIGGSIYVFSLWSFIFQLIIAKKEGKIYALRSSSLFYKETNPIFFKILVASYVIMIALLLMIPAFILFIYFKK